MENDFNDVMSKVAEYVPQELFNALQDVIEQEASDNYRAGYDEGYKVAQTEVENQS